MTAAAAAHAFILEHELGEHIAKLTAEAPEINSVQLETLRAIFRPDATEAGAQPASVQDDTDRTRAPGRA
jgi:hypothetical protein